MTAMMCLTADFYLCFEQLQDQPANDNRLGDADFTTRNLATVELTYMLATISRDKGVP